MHPKDRFCDHFASKFGCISFFSGWGREPKVPPRTSYVAPFSVAPYVPESGAYHLAPELHLRRVLIDRDTAHHTITCHRI